MTEKLHWQDNALFLGKICVGDIGLFTTEENVWFACYPCTAEDLGYSYELKRFVSESEARTYLENFVKEQSESRVELSVTPITKDEWEYPRGHVDRDFNSSI